MTSEISRKNSRQGVGGLLAAVGIGVGVVWALKNLVERRENINLRGRTVLITGGARGLGLVMAREFARDGAHIAICSRSADDLAAAERELTANGTKVFAEVCDVTDEKACQNFVEKVRGELGEIEVLVNNAGVISVMPFENSSRKEFEESLNTHFWGVYNMISAVLPSMRERRSGRIVNIASVGGKVSVPHLLPYSTGKFALVGFSEGLRAELLKDNIYVTTVCPGLMRTGSPRHAVVKGNHEREYAIFKIADSLPLITVSAEEAAKQIVSAARRGAAEIIISLPAQFAAVTNGLFPSAVSDSMALVNQFLPSAVPDGDERRRGMEVETLLSKNFLTATTDEAAVRNNEKSADEE